MQSLRNEDYTDRELLFIIEACMNGVPWAKTEDIALALGLDSKRGKYSTAIRLSWMVRKGWMMRNPDESGEWGILPIGYELMSGSLRAPVQKALDAMTPGQSVLMMRDLGIHMKRAQGPEAEMMRRQFLHDQAQRRK